MSAGAWGYAIGSGLMMFLFFLIFLGLLALIPPLRQRFRLRNVLAWLVSVLFIGYLTGSGGGAFAPLLLGAILCAGLAGLRYWYATRKAAAETTSPSGRA
jgi:hypothetical protein